MLAEFGSLTIDIARTARDHSSKHVCCPLTLYLYFLPVILSLSISSIGLSIREKGKIYI